MIRMLDDQTLVIPKRAEDVGIIGDGVEYIAQQDKLYAVWLSEYKLQEELFKRLTDNA